MPNAYPTGLVLKFFERPLGSRFFIELLHKVNVLYLGESTFKAETKCQKLIWIGGRKSENKKARSWGLFYCTSIQRLY